MPKLVIDKMGKRRSHKRLCRHVDASPSSVDCLIGRPDRTFKRRRIGLGDNGGEVFENLGAVTDQDSVSLLVRARLQQLRHHLAAGHPHDCDPVLSRQLDETLEVFDAKLLPVVGHGVAERNPRLLAELHETLDRLLDVRPLGDSTLNLLKLAHLLGLQEPRLRFARLAKDRFEPTG